MKIILTSIGTRGDIEPFLAVGKLLQNRGHQIICLFPEQFRGITEDTGLEFVSLGSKFIELLESSEGKIAMSGGRFGFKKLKAYIKLIQRQPEANKEMVISQENCIKEQNPDRIVHHAKTIYPVLWSRINRGKTTLLCPVPYMHYVKEHAHVAFRKNYGTFINKLTYKITNYSLVKSISYSQKWLVDKSLQASSKNILKALSNNKAIYTISPSLFSRPKYWAKNLQVLGFYERNKAVNWKPSAELEDFIEKHDKIVMVTFGSMINAEPQKNTTTILKVLEQNRIPAILNTCEGGLIKPKGYNTNLFHFVERIPYDWAFPKMYAVVHHGGSGTTHMAIKNGCANLIIPHIIDQYVWNKIVHQKGIGPLGVDIGKISTDNLEPKILDLMQNQAYKEKAKKLSRAMALENLEEELCNTIIG